MKKTIKLISSLALALVLALSMTVTSFAASSVTYEGNAKEFVFEPGSEYSPTDLFTNFKGVMPGDQLTQIVNIKNDSALTVEIFMRADGPTGIDGVVTEADSADFLKEMNLTVKGPGNNELFDAPANETAGLTDWVSLGKFAPGADIDLNVALNVPITMGNDYQQRIGALDWTFKVVEYPNPTGGTDPGKDDGAKTGDDFNPWVMGGIALAALAVIIAILAGRRKQSE